jgi:hypothetical protein
MSLYQNVRKRSILLVGDSGRLWYNFTMRTCIHCKRTMEDKKFVNKGNGRRVNVCHACRYRTRNQNYKDRMNAKRGNYVLEDGQKDKLFKEQKGLCAICKDSTKLVVDHDHKTGIIRGLLCRNCNIGLGNMKDSPDILRAASLYIAKY